MNVSLDRAIRTAWVISGLNLAQAAQFWASVAASAPAARARIAERVNFMFAEECLILLQKFKCVFGVVEKEGKQKGGRCTAFVSPSGTSDDIEQT